MRFLFGLGRQRARVAVALHIASSFFVSGVLTFAFQSISSTRPRQGGFAPLALSWSATFLTVQVLWIGATQTLGRYVAEREAQGSDWGPVVSSVRRWQIGLAVVFVLGALLASPALTGQLFGSAWLTVGVHCGRRAVTHPSISGGGSSTVTGSRFALACRSWRSRRASCSSPPCCSP